MTTELAAGCARFVADGGKAVLPDGFEMADDEVLISAAVAVSVMTVGGTALSGGVIEVVLALDVTASMNAAIDRRYPKTPW